MRFNSQKLTAKEHLDFATLAAHKVHTEKAQKVKCECSHYNCVSIYEKLYTRKKTKWFKLMIVYSDTG
jgi:hypothetical protein